MTVEEVFLAALEIADANARTKYVETVCGDNAALRKEVEELLASHSRSGLFLDVPAAQQMLFESSQKGSGPAPPTTHILDRNELLGAVLDGKYKLIEAIGEGGMGTVFMAQQLAPLVRAVAVKVVKSGMDSKAVLARFDAERQALAMMDHPNIAKVLDAGMTPSGRPFFVMELVKGVPITKFCDERHLTPRQRLELFVPVCQAIQHAHQKGIIHRDIKPSNVLIALYDDRPVPKVIDFGVAKAVAGPALTDKTLMTDFGMVVGTPEYMSPEQASLNNLDVDTRSDVYSLGVLLYELLTGTTPVDRKSLNKVVFHEILRIIREVEAPKPSAKLSTIDNLPSVAANRGMEPAHLSKLMKGELDWVVLKAIEKDRTRRYETANALSRDVQRYLADEFVEARPPSRGYRLRKFVNRHKGPVIAASLVLFAILAGFAGTAWGLVLAQQNERKALAAVEAEKEAKEREGTQRTAAEKARDRTRSVLDAMVSDVTGDSLATQKEISAEQKKFLQGVLGYYREFADEPTNDELSRQRHAQAARRVGTIEYRLGRKEESAAAIRLARDSYASLAAEFPTTPEYRQELARSHTGLGLLLVDLGQRAAAVEHFRNGLTIQKNLVAEFPDAPEYRRDLALGHSNQGSLLHQLGQAEVAAEQFQNGLVIQQNLVAEFPAVTEYRRDLARSHYNQGNVLKSLGRQPSAVEQHRKGLVIREKLVADLPTVAAYQNELASSHTNLGNLHKELGQLAVAQEQYRKALVIQEKLVADFPAVAAYRANLALSCYNQGVLLTGLGQRAAAVEQYRKAIVIQEKLVAEFPAIATYRANLALSHQGLGQLSAEAGQRAAGEEQYRQGLLIQDKLAADFPAVPAYRQDLARSHYNLGMMLNGYGQLALAQEQYRKAIVIQEKLVAEFPAIPAYRPELARSHNKLGILLNNLGQSAAANEQHRMALAIREKLAAEFPNVPDYHIELGGSYCNYGNTIRVENSAESVTWYSKAIDCLQAVHVKDHRAAIVTQFLRNSHVGRAQAYHQLQQYVKALEDWDHERHLRPPRGGHVAAVRQGVRGLGSRDRTESARSAVGLSGGPGHFATQCGSGSRSGSRGQRTDKVTRAVPVLL